MEERSSSPTSEKRHSRFFRFSLRFLLLVITIASIAFGIFAYKIQQAKRQEAAVRELEKLGAKPMRTILRQGMFYSGGKVPAPRLKWLHQFLGEEYFTYVPLIDVQNPSLTADNIRNMIPLLEKIRLVEGINEAGKTYITLNDIGNPNVDSRLIQEFQRRLPQVVFMSTLVGRPATNSAGSTYSQEAK